MFEGEEELKAAFENALGIARRVRDECVLPAYKCREKHRPAGSLFECEKRLDQNRRIVFSISLTTLGYKAFVIPGISYWDDDLIAIAEAEMEDPRPTQRGAFIGSSLLSAAKAVGDQNIRITSKTNEVEIAQRICEYFRIVEPIFQRFARNHSTMLSMLDDEEMAWRLCDSMDHRYRAWVACAIVNGRPRSAVLEIIGKWRMRASESSALSTLKHVIPKFEETILRNYYPN